MHSYVMDFVNDGRNIFFLTNFFEVKKTHKKETLPISMSRGTQKKSDGERVKTGWGKKPKVGENHAGWGGRNPAAIGLLRMAGGTKKVHPTLYTYIAGALSPDLNRAMSPFQGV